jgi:DNA-binding NarL/FixJ family response regulator
MTDVRDERRRAAIGIAFFVVIVLLIGSDLVFDYREGTPVSHLLVESLILAAATLGLAMGWRRFVAARAESRLLRRDLERALAEARRWREESRALIEGLGEAIDRQFKRWELTPAEAEVGVLLLKGLSHREAAEVRSTSERTVRQQARSLYKKAGLAGRSELAAFFLEDLLLPRRP